MAKTALTVTINAPGLRETLTAFRRLPKDANAELRDGAQKLSELLATRARAAASADSRQAAALAPTIRPVRDRVPAIQVGGSTRVTSSKVPAWRILFGAEFGMNRRSGWYGSGRFNGSAGRQFRRHLGAEGYWFFPVVEANESTIMREWQATADRIIAAFTRGGE